MMKIEEYNMEYNEKNLPLAKWLIDKTNTKGLSHRESLRNEAPKGGRGSFENSGWQR